MLVRHALMGTLTVSLASGFTQPNPQTIRRPATTTSSSSRVFSTIERPKSIPPPPLNNVDGIGQSNNNNQPPIAYDCNDEAECVEVPICDDVQCRTSLDVRIHSTWYDLSGWRKAHPAGPHWIDWYDGRDATDVMDAFHSTRGREMYKRLPKSTEQTAMVLDASVAPYSTTELAFRELRDKLEKDGWWERDYTREAILLGIWTSLFVGAAATVDVAPPLSAFLLALSMTNAGWLGHDYIHGVDKFSNTMRPFAAVAAGLGPTWWSDKHNKHHALTNEMGVDEDIATDPFLYTYAPDPKHDSPLSTLAPISNIESLDFCAISVVSLYNVPSSLPENTQ
jgi:hypothetical protein